jgi:hypothetical protein
MIAHRIELSQMGKHTASGHARRQERLVRVAQDRIGYP